MAKSAKASGAKKRKKADTSTFKTYIARVLRQVHPKVRISQKSMSILNSLVQDTFDKVASEGGLRGAGGLAPARPVLTSSRAFPCGQRQTRASPCHAPMP